MRFPKNKKALAITIVFHLVVLILFMIFGLTQPDPLPEEIGVEIAMADLGNSVTGSGNNPSPQPTTNPEPAPSKATPTPTPTSSPSSQPKVVEQDASEVATEKAEKAPVKKEEPAKEPEKVEEEPKPQVNKRALYPGNKTKDSEASQGGSQGNTGGKGDMGSEEGKPQGKGILGGGMGSWELSGRSLVKGTAIEDTKEEGIVVLNIWVDRYGNVTRTAPNLAESNTTSQYLFDLATKAAKQSKYSPKSNAAVEQKGKMTFKFILK
ncbi:energy transducer TonB [Luteibaculum oceani]|uniref:Energy transducer TonB n=1 Tax=Luteibaculum oceani TaxID=1294296 RepID=A0A5C6V2A6_9FLAO|nr:hypothetical protein [Luteibaculum oceani]TXC78781.1 hypothetical protein FRX97_06075 [Luteibaculum oceani]